MELVQGVYKTGRMDETEVAAFIKEQNDERSSVLSWAKIQIRRMMLASAQKAGVMLDGRLVHKFGHIQKSWAKDGTDQNVRWLYFVFFGDFEKNPTWSQRLETEYMEKNRIVLYAKLNGETRRAAGVL
jgi:hypothetical protein